VKRTIPQLISVLAITLGLTLFAATLLTLDRQQTLDEARTLGLALPLVLIPSLGWHLLRAAGWYVCFPPDQRPSYWRIFRVRLAADGVAYFTIRGVASEPLRVVLLLGHVPATVAAAASVLERTAMGIMSVVGVGVFATLAVSSDVLPPEWERGFRVIAILAGFVLVLTALFLTRTGHYFGPLFERIHRRTGWRWTGGRTIHFITSVEDLFLTLARTDRRRIRTLVLLSMACYALMALEVWVVFWTIGQPISLWTGTIVETFTRSVSVLGGMIPGNLGALEASNIAVVKALGLGGGGSLALVRRVRSLLWASAGLAVYPRDTMKGR
jgi:uncharacterized protein (TIRG00374 family)